MGIKVFGLGHARLCMVKVVRVDSMQDRVFSRYETWEMSIYAGGTRERGKRLVLVP